MNEDVIWITKNGVHVPITNAYMNDKIRSKIVNFEEPKKLSELEYQTLCDKFEKSLTDEEKKLIKHYGVGAGYNYEFNDPELMNLERTYRFSDNSKKGFKEEKISFYDAVVNRELDKKASFIKTNDEWSDENADFAYTRTMDAKKFFRNMDNVIENKGLVLDKDIVVYRKGYEKFDNGENEFIRRGYTSTSAKSRINKNTPGGMKLGSNEFEIIVPKGTKFLPIKNLVDNDIKSQNEIILPRNLKFTLVENKSNEGGWNYEKSEYEKPKTKYVVRVGKE